MIYKVVKVRELHDEAPIAVFEGELNGLAEEGWTLHSLVPQIDQNGTYNNVAIFYKNIE